MNHTAWQHCASILLIRLLMKNFVGSRLLSCTGIMKAQVMHCTQLFCRNGGNKLSLTPSGFLRITKIGKHSGVIFTFKDLLTTWLHLLDKSVSDSQSKLKKLYFYHLEMPMSLFFFLMKGYHQIVTLGNWSPELATLIRYVEHCCIYIQEAEDE